MALNLAINISHCDKLISEVGKNGNIIYSHNHNVKTEYRMTSIRLFVFLLQVISRGIITISGQPMLTIE